MTSGFCTRYNGSLRGPRSQSKANSCCPKISGLEMVLRSWLDLRFLLLSPSAYSFRESLICSKSDLNLYLYWQKPRNLPTLALEQISVHIQFLSWQLRDGRQGVLFHGCVLLQCATPSFCSHPPPPLPCTIVAMKCNLPDKAQLLRHKKFLPVWSFGHLV